MKRNVGSWLAAAAVAVGLALLAWVARDAARTPEPGSTAAASNASTRGSSPAGAARASKRAASTACDWSDEPIAARGTLGVLSMLAPDAREQALAMSIGYPHAGVPMAQHRVAEPAVQLARNVVTDETLARLASAPFVGFAVGERDARLAVFAGVVRSELQLDEGDGVAWLAPDTVGIFTGSVIGLCRRGPRSALDRLRELDPTLTRSATMAGYWVGELGEIAPGCRDMIGAIHLGTNRRARGHGYVMCETAEQATFAAPRLAAWRPHSESAPIPGSVLPAWQPEGVVPSAAVAQGTRVRVEFGGRIELAPPRVVSADELRYYRRGEAEPPWERLDPYGVPEMDGPPPGYENIDPWDPRDPRRPGGPVASPEPAPEDPRAANAPTPPATSPRRGPETHTTGIRR